MPLHKRGYQREDGLVLIRRKHGQEIYGTIQELEDMRQKHREYMAKLRIINKDQKKWKIGEFNPENNLYFIRKSGNLKPMWGTIEQLQIHIKKRKQIKINYIQKMKAIKSIPEQKRKRGDVDPILNLYFWKYNYISGKEIWLTKEKFIIQRIKESKNK